MVHLGVALGPVLKFQEHQSALRVHCKLVEGHSRPWQICPSRCLQLGAGFRDMVELPGILPLLTRGILAIAEDGLSVEWDPGFRNL